MVGGTSSDSFCTVFCGRFDDRCSSMQLTLVLLFLLEIESMLGPAKSGEEGDKYSCKLKKEMVERREQLLILVSQITYNIIAFCHIHYTSQQNPNHFVWDIRI